MSIKHGLLMSLVLGTTAALGTLGVVPALQSAAPTAHAATLTEAAPAPTSAMQLASATPAPAKQVFTTPATSSSPEIVVEVGDQLPEGLTIEPVKMAKVDTKPVAPPAQPVVGAPPAAGLDPLTKATCNNVVTCDQVYYDFNVFPSIGPAPLPINLTCTSSIMAPGGGPTSTLIKAVAIQWYLLNPEDPTEPATLTTILDPLQGREFPVDAVSESYTFNSDGVYDIGMRIVFCDGSVCPPATDASNNPLPSFIKRGAAIVGTTGTATAMFEAKDLTCDLKGAGVLPLQDWVPLLAFKVQFNHTNPALRVLAHLNYDLVDDAGTPIQTDDLLKFALFVDGSPGRNPADQILDQGVDGHISYIPSPNPGGNVFSPLLVAGKPMFEWDRNGYPYRTPTNTLGVASYNLNFIFDPTAPGFLAGDPYNLANPQFPFLKPQLDPLTLGPEMNWPIAWDDLTGYGYILAVRVASTWQADEPLRVRVGTTPDGDPNFNRGVDMLPYEPSDFVNFIFAPYWAPVAAFANLAHVSLPMGMLANLNTPMGIVANGDVVARPGQVDFAEPVQTNPIVVEPFPFNTSGKPLDTYNPNFFDNDVLAEDCGRIGAFDVWDYTGGLGYDSRAYPSPLGVVNNVRTDWNWPNKLYTPVAEHARPRWDKGETVVDFITGEWMDLRRVFSVEEWMPVIGINAHGNCTSYLKDINVILTDIDADPYGPPGNGGFNPITGLHHMTADVHGNNVGPSLNDLYAIGSDYTFNGIGVFNDTGGGNPCGGNNGGNGVFDPPTPKSATSASGVGFTDLPLVPLPFSSPSIQNKGYFQWEYIPFPPGGGDPWWRMRMRFSTPDDSSGDVGARGPLPADGNLEEVPDPDADFFVVIRADSGNGDVSGLQGDGTGMPFGADTRAFVEPRNWNPLDGGHWEGGILFTGTTTIDNVNTPKYWQDSFDNTIANLGNPEDCDVQDCQVDNVITLNNFHPEPWFPERTQNPDNIKPIRCGLDVHDLVLTYSSTNRYAKESFINVGQRIGMREYTDAGPPLDQVNVPPLQTPAGAPLWVPDLARTDFSLWMDPPVVRDSGFSPELVGLIPGPISQAFHHHNDAGVLSDNSDAIAPVEDEFTEEQYAFETVPFALDPGISFTNVDAPLSSFYPNPAPQPTLPDITTWPQIEIAINSRAQMEATDGKDHPGYCYLSDERTPDEPFINLTSTGSEATYEDDVFIFGVLNASDLVGVQPGMWLIDRFGGRFRILDVNANEMTLQHGASAYPDEFYEFPGPALKGKTKLSVPKWPYPYTDLDNNGSLETHLLGQQYATYRGDWTVVQDTLTRDEYPRLSNWPAGEGNAGGARAARVLKQHVMQESMPTAVMGLNIAGVADPVVNLSQEATLRSITVAFWGPEFDPAQLAKLDEDGTLVSSGVLLYEDTNGANGGFTGSGVFDGPLFSDLTTAPAFRDQIVPLQIGSLSWQAEPEPIDLNGDYIADDLSGDGLAVFTQDQADHLSPADKLRWDGYFDNAWVLRILPSGWTIPHTDFNAALLGVSGAGKSESIAPEFPEQPWAAKIPDFWTKAPKSVDFSTGLQQKAGPKNLSKVGNFGDDLFVVIRTSEELKSFEQIRCVMPARLPSRTTFADQIGGVQFSPENYLSTSSFAKQSPEEGPVQDYYGHDMLEASVPARVLDLTGNLAPATIVPGRLILPGGPPEAVLGIDASANRPENLIAAGSGGTVQDNVFTTGSLTLQPGDTYLDGDGWKPTTVGLWLLTMSAATDKRDSRMEAYEIVSVSGSDLTLRSGTPAADTAWQIVKNPTFLEQVIVELYDRGSDGGFDPTQDLLPLNDEDPLHDKFSGVSLWRDNDLSPLNRNGQFDPPFTDSKTGELVYVDLPVRLDHPPTFIGEVGEPQFQVRMTFSSPGTDNSTGRNTVPYENQALLRQPVPQGFGRAESDPDFGSDFFLVLRTSRNMILGDDFQAAIVSWGPDTPTEPDPDNFSVSLGATTPAGQHDDEFDIFSEFPATERGLGFITFFQKPQPIRYWSFDQDKRKIVPVTEVDHSQDNSPITPAIYWQRSTANVAARTQTLTSLPSPTLDFTADRHRQAPGLPVAFTLITSSKLTAVNWKFGDGTTSNATNPTHSYALEGTYNVQVTITDEFGIQTTKRKDKFIEITNKPLADFSASPLSGRLSQRDGATPEIGFDVTFTDLSQGDDTYVATKWSWSFGDGTTATTTTPAAFVHRYGSVGFFTVTQEVTFTNNSDGTTITRICKLSNLITVRACIDDCGQTGEGEGEGEGEGQTTTPKADFKVTSEVRDKEAVVPLSDWVPLLNFTLSYDEMTPAPRVLSDMDIELRGDSRSSADLGYANVIGPDHTDFLEFGIFQETKATDDAKNHELDTDNDFLLFKFDNFGSPIGSIAQEGLGFVEYRLDFIGNGTPTAPQFPIVAGPKNDNTVDGNSYILAVRTSPTWRSQTTMRCDVFNARMIFQRASGGFPRDNMSKPVDTYSPDFDSGKILEDKVGYSSSFDVWNLVGNDSGVPGQDQAPGNVAITEFDSWSNPRLLYTPLAEHSRPRWSSFGHLLNAVGGEFLQMRPLVGLEQWVPVIGINAQSTKSVHVDDDDFNALLLRDVSPLDAAEIREVNVIMTDVGGDPFGPPGNGGFNPTSMLHSVSSNVTNTANNSDYAAGKDVTFNGVWLWNDTNGNGVFDPPTPTGGLDAPSGGVDMNGDRPMNPQNLLDAKWEYVPLPPGGGDPWWKVKMSFLNGTRRLNGKDDKLEGYLKKVPNIEDVAGITAPGVSEYLNDYFVVIRPKSGAQDVSTISGDGIGMPPGSDFRAFIEPRRFNALTGQSDGGIYLDSMLPPKGLLNTDGTITSPWQDDDRWGAIEPWWPQRTVNANATQKLQSGVEVHDLVLTYESDSNYKAFSDLFFGGGSSGDDTSGAPNGFGTCLGYAFPGQNTTDFDRWLDPFGLLSGQFLNGHTVGVTKLSLEFVVNFPLAISDTITDTLTFSLIDGASQFSFETVPFNNRFDGATTPRSFAYPVPPAQPALPEYATWSFDLAPGTYPRLSQWADADNKARLLTQKTDVEGDVTAMLGINAVGTADPFVNRGTPAAIQSITVAFWGPDFNPDKLQPLDPTGVNTSSGVMLWEDSDKNLFGTDAGFGLSVGTFMPPTTLQDYLQFQDAFGLLDQFDKPVPVTNLNWGKKAELVDLDGDGVPDDMNGDGVVDNADRAWVVTLTPKVAWAVPNNDLYNDAFVFHIAACVGGGTTAKTGYQSTLGVSNGSKDNKALDPTLRNAGDDLFVSVRTSDKMSRFEKFRAVVPATLPERPVGQRTGGVQFSTGPETSLQAAIKSNPDEDPEQDFYGNDTLEVNVPTRILDQTNQTQTIVIGGAATPTLALDLATNLDLTEDSGADGSGADKTFTVAGKAWAPNAYAKSHWLVDSAYESYQITGNTANQLSLLSGTPRGGKWRIVKDPTFFEQLIVEFYNEGQDSEFNPVSDLLPLNSDEELSGVALYRDNDNDPNNRNGVFDPGIDIPVTLDVAPFYVNSGGDIQVKFVFSSPGTDDYAGAIRDTSGNIIAGGGVSMADQPRHRQWVQDSFGSSPGDPNTGADFFVVVRASTNMSPGDNFRVGIVNWGPNTPTEPDPDTWAGLNSNERNDFTKFEEFPWGQRGVGYVSFFDTPPPRYFMDGTKAKVKPDNSGYHWIRSHSTKKRRSGVIQAITRPVNSTSLLIDGASVSQLPPQILPGETFPVTINGRGFGSKPEVHLSGYTVSVVSASDTNIGLSLTTPAGVIPQDPIVLIVRNPATNDTQSRSDLFSLQQVGTGGPRVTAVIPARGDATVFPVTITGQHFPTIDKIKVLFGTSLMNVKAVSADGTSILAEQPANGLPGAGPMNVTVQSIKANNTIDAQDTLVNGFDYVNNGSGGKQAGLLCAPGGPASNSTGGDWALIGAALALLSGATLRRRQTNK